MNIFATKKIILACVLATSAASAFAEWTKVSESDDGEVSFYIDYKSIRKDGNLRKVWMVHDYMQAKKGGYKSVRLMVEFDCKAERYRTLTISGHSENMVLGATLGTENPSAPQWVYIPPSSSIETTLKIVCAK